MAINEILYDKIIEMARKGKTITYEPVMKLVGLKLGNYGAAKIGRMLEEICSADYKDDRPLSGAIVVSKANEMPSPGFFKLAKSLGRQTDQTDADFFQSERLRVFEYWKANRNTSRKVQYWLEIYWPERSERDFLAIWFHKKKRYKPSEFHAGDMVLFYEIMGENPDGYRGAGAIFASGVLTGDKLEEVQERFRNWGGKEWEQIWRVSPKIQVSPKEGVSFHDIIEQLPKFKGWVRTGTKLSKKDFDLLESMLREQEDLEKELTYKEGAETRFTQTVRERNQKLKEAAIRKYGNKCMVCNFDFNKFYGEKIANGYIEVHHEQMLSQSLGERETSLNQVKVVCSNCHRMIHRTKEMLDWAELKKKIAPERHM